MASGHIRKRSDRVLPRRTTVGPLDAPDDPLSGLTSPTSPAASSVNPLDSIQSPTRSPTRALAEVAESSAKDLGFLLESSVYHPVSQLEIPAPFRVAFPPLIKEDNLQKHFEQLDELLSAGRFLQAAYFTASILSSGKVRATDLDIIFRLLQIRFSCLELTGNTGLAAQEAKTLEDLNSAFYFVIDESGAEEHIMPYSLRLQALRLQSVGFGDPRRGISTLYDLGLECREKIVSTAILEEDRVVWRSRLQDIGIRVVNALVEMGDLDTARRTLQSQLPRTEGSSESLSADMLTRIVLLLIKIGDISSAKDLVQANTQGGNGMLEALLSVSEGRWEDAVKIWQEVDKGSLSGEGTVIKQNLAVALLYVGRLPEARELMEDLIQNGQGFQSLTFNLATLYELSMANPYASKRQMAERVARQSGGLGQNWGRSNVDFKL